MLGIGFIGFGKITTRYHIPYLLNRKDKICIKEIYFPTIDRSVMQ